MARPLTQYESARCRATPEFTGSRLLEFTYALPVMTKLCIGTGENERIGDEVIGKYIKVKFQFFNKKEGSITAMYPDKEFDYGDGMIVPYIDIGPRDGEPIFLFHRWIANMVEAWLVNRLLGDVLNAVPAGYRVITA